MSLITPLRRTAIIVRDMERSLLFYQSALGMRVWKQGEAGAEVPALYQLLGMPPCHTRWVILQAGRVDWGMVGLFELTDPAPTDDTHPYIDRVNRGEACLVFHTPDIADVHTRALAMGLTVLCPPTRLEMRSGGVSSIEMTLRDPNGVLVNFIQTLRSAQPGPINRFPGLKARVTGKKKRLAAKRRSGASRGRRSG